MKTKRLFYSFFSALFFLGPGLNAQNPADTSDADKCILELSDKKLRKEHECTIVFKNVNVVDVESGKIKKHRTVFMYEGYISKIKRNIFSGSKRGAKVINCSGKFLAPGLTDMHVHFTCTNRDKLLYLLYGVTTIRNMAGSEFHLRDRDFTDSRELLSPKMITAGPPITSEKSFMCVEVYDTASAKREVNAQWLSGYNFIKTERKLRTDCFFAVLDEAKKLNVCVAAELPTGISLSDLKPFENILTIENSDGIKFTDAASFKLFAQSKILNCPNLVFAANAAKIKSVDKWVSKSPEALILSIFQNDALFSLNTKGVGSLFTTEYKERKSIFKKMRLAGMKFLAGTESGLQIPALIPGSSLHDEMNEFILAGMTPVEAIRCATINGEKIMNPDSTKQAGLRKNKFTDVVLLSSDPLEDIKNYRAIEGVLINGAWLNKEDLDEIRKKLSEIKE